MSYEYKITKAELGYNVCRMDEGVLDYLGANMKWIKDRLCAKLFYHKEDALSGLVLAKFKGREGKKGIVETLETPSKSEETLEKKS